MVLFIIHEPMSDRVFILKKKSKTIQIHFMIAGVASHTHTEYIYALPSTFYNIKFTQNTSSLSNTRYKMPIPKGTQSALFHTTLV